MDAPADAPFGVEIKDIPLQPNRNVDLLFLIDDSPSMGDKQVRLAAAFPRFIDELATLQGGVPSVHIAVVTSDLGTRDANGVIAPNIGMLGRGGCAASGKAGNMQLFGAPVSGALFISDIVQMDGTRRVNYTGALPDAFQQMAKAGDGGCGFEQHLEALKQALQSGNTANAGFLRPEAYLAVVLVTDEDDCSVRDSLAMFGPDGGPLGPLQSFRCTRYGVLCDRNGATPEDMNQLGQKERCHPNDDSQYLAKVSDYVAFLKSLKPEPDSVVVAGIMGTSDPVATELRVPVGQTVAVPALAHSCMYIDDVGKVEVADPPIRLRWFLDQFPNRNAFVPICNRDLSGALQQIGTLLKHVIGNACIEGQLADVDPSTAGLQYDCSVSSVVNPNTPQQVKTTLPRCTPEDATASNKPCWHLGSDPALCIERDHLMLRIEGLDALPTRGHLIASCRVEPAS
jgi:hypothetical protein